MLIGNFCVRMMGRFTHAALMVFTGEKPNDGVYSWPTERMVCPISIALPDGISSRDTTS